MSNNPTVHFVLGIGVRLCWVTNLVSLRDRADCVGRTAVTSHVTNSRHLGLSMKRHVRPCGHQILRREIRSSASIQSNARLAVIVIAWILFQCEQPSSAGLVCAIFLINCIGQDVERYLKFGDTSTVPIGASLSKCSLDGGWVIGRGRR